MNDKFLLLIFNGLLVRLAEGCEVDDGLPLQFCLNLRSLFRSLF